MFQAKCIVFTSGLILFLSIYIIILIQSTNIAHKHYDLISSVWCSKDNSMTERMCRFRNLCYRIDLDEFVFVLHKQRSLLVNVPENRFHPSLQYLGSVEHNNFHFNYVQVDYAIHKELFRNHKFVLLKDPTLIYSRFKPDNLMHSLHDDLLPLYHTLTLASFGIRKSTDSNAKPILLENVNLFLFDNYHRIENDHFAKNFYSTVLKNTNLFYKPDFKIKDQLVCFQDVLIGLDKATLWYDYGFKHPQKSILKTNDQRRLIRIYTNEIRNAILKVNSFDVRSCNAHYTILISRRKSRLIVNEDQLIDQLISSFGYKVLRLDLDSDVLANLEYLVKAISCSKYMIGMHGAGLVLSMFLPEKANLIELFPYKINATHYTPYRQLADIYDLNYFEWTNRLRSNNFFNKKYLKDEIKHKIDADLEVEQTLCCDEPYFLFRIYQDTYVDLDEMKRLFTRINEKNTSDALNISPKSDLFISPSKVLINCIRFNQTIELNWSKPWNLMSEENIEYEILVTVDQRSTLYHTKDNQLVISLDKKSVNHNSKILVWIKASQDHLYGPFDDKPCYC